MRLRDFIDSSLAAPAPEALFTRFAAYLEGFKIDVWSYHVLTEHFASLPMERGFIHAEFPQAWVDRYRAMNYFEIDPIIPLSRTCREPFRWYEVGKLTKLTAAQQDYLADLRAHGLKDGLAIPIFGPRGNSAYFGAGSTKATLTLDEADGVEIQYACNQVHNRYLELVGGDDGAKLSLSPREREVLTWVVKGKSNSVIAELLGVSEHTVDTLVRRSFTKLGVSDRISAALKAVGLGIVQI